MITAESLRVSCGCRSVGECHHNTFAETNAFEAVVDQFAEAMKRKFRAKWIEGRSGWDDPANAAGIRAGMIDHANRGPGQEIDVANMAAMLWNISNG